MMSILVEALNRLKNRGKMPQRKTSVEIRPCAIFCGLDEWRVFFDFPGEPGRYSELLSIEHRIAKLGIHRSVDTSADGAIHV